MLFENHRLHHVLLGLDSEEDLFKFLECGHLLLFGLLHTCHALSAFDERLECVNAISRCELVKSLPDILRECEDSKLVEADEVLHLVSQDLDHIFRPLADGQLREHKQQFLNAARVKQATERIRQVRNERGF